MANELGYDQILKGIDFIIELGNVIPKMIKAKNWVSRLIIASSLGDELVGLIKIKPREFKAQWLDLTKEERNEILQHVVEKYDITDDNLEAHIEAGFAIAIELSESIEKIINYAKKFKG